MKSLALVIIGTLFLKLSAPAATIRGFGQVTPEPITFPGLEGLKFQCDSPEHALILVAKIGHDMSPTATVPVSWQSIAIDGTSAPVLVRQGFGSILLAAKGDVAYACATSGTDHLAAAFSSAAGALAGAHFYDPNFRYPMYLDKFSGRGIGSWYPYGLGLKDKSLPNTVDDHMKFLQANNMAIQPNAGGYILRDLLPIIHKYGRPYHFADWLGWTPEQALLSPEDINTPGKNFVSLASYYGEISFGGKKLLDYRRWVFGQQLKQVVNDPNLVDCLDPDGEVGPSSFQLYWDFSENNRRHMADWLEHDRGYTLQSLSQAWYGGKRQFTSWDQVPIPMDYELFGLTPEGIRADPVWRVHSGEYREALARGYTNAGFDDRNWLSLTLPGGQLLPSIQKQNKIFWYRGTINVPQEWLDAYGNKGRIYLNIATLSPSGDSLHPTKFWFNGREAGGISLQPGAPIHGPIDVTGLVKAGKNEIVFQPKDWFWIPEGTVYLSPKPMESYPFSDTHLNARYVDWHNYVSYCVADNMENTYKLIRSIDPNRSIKMMAALDKDLVIPLQAKYQAFGHNTGDEAFFRPWDKHFGYPRGIPTSAESSGTQADPNGLKRWIGWFHFTGLNAFDNFYSVQAMMYQCASIWKEYLPYLHLGNRRDMKKPDIALFWSSLNNRLLTRSVPFCYDLGRGDLQPLGYSYVYTDESGLRDGLDKNYPLIWDCATEVMDPDTLRRLKAYVEAGGTYVALQETGRHTSLKRDAWPITELTGFKVREVRPMTGTVTILEKQPLFTALAGKTFYNLGTSIDYSGYNYADKCVVLDPVAPDTQVIARYNDGGIAIGMRKLGKGRVVVLGSPFWRDSYDKAGIWWAGEDQDEFLEDIFHGLGLKPLATADTHKVWREHYLANNGTEEYLALWNPYPDPVTFSTDWTTVHPAQCLFDPKNGHPIPGTINGTDVRLDKVTLAPLETLVVAAAVTRKPTDALNDWFSKYALWMRPSAPGVKMDRPDLPMYELPVSFQLQGKKFSDADFTKLDLAALSANPAPVKGFSHDTGFSPDSQTDLPPTDHFVFRAVFDSPPSWKAGEPCQLHLRAFEPRTTVDAWVNGKQVLTQANIHGSGYSELIGGTTAEVGPVLNFGKPNVLVFTTGTQGFMGDAVFDHYPVPVETAAVTGNWQVQATEDSGLVPAQLPGAFTGLIAFKHDITVPASWKGSRVFLRIEPADPRQFGQALINNEALFLGMNGAVTYADVTPWVKFGQPNSLAIIPKKANVYWTPGPLAIKRITLEKVTPVRD